jgi:hypothetical protein
VICVASATTISGVRRHIVGLAALGLMLVGRAGAAESYSPHAGESFPSQVYWGDTHVHTNLSADSVFTLDQDDAYRFARAVALRVVDQQVRPDGGVDPVGNTVDVRRATYTNTIGDTELTAVWHDPDFDPDERAFYYVRALEIPTPRWTAYDAKFYVAKFYSIDSLDAEIPWTTQERVYTSPIWYSPDR